MAVSITQEGRFSRLEAIEWWDQALLARSRVLVIGAGALGNEVLKNLALLGIGHVDVVDLDRVEMSNLSRSVLFRASDEGRFKAECAVEAIRRIYPEIRARAIVGNVLADVGLGDFHRADIVVGALDNREARVFVNAACARVGRPWIDGGIEVLQGIVRGFRAATTACYECTMSSVDWELLNKRRSCSLIARRAIAARGTPTTPTIASIVGGMQVQEVVKHLHGQAAMLGRGLFFDGGGHQSYTIDYRRSEDCPWHEPPPPIRREAAFTHDTPLRSVWNVAVAELGAVEAIDFSREVVRHVDCPRCGARRDVYASPETVAADRLACAACGAEGAPTFMHSVVAGDPALDRTIAQLGLPRHEIVWARCHDRIVGWEMSGDEPPIDDELKSN